MRWAAAAESGPGLRRPPGAAPAPRAPAVDIALLDFADAAGEFGALVDQPQQVAVDGVDAVAQLASSIESSPLLALQRQIPHGQHALDAGDRVDHGLLHLLSTSTRV
jgi:hypothetical protein